MKLRTADSKPGRYGLKRHLLFVVLHVPEEGGSPWCNCTSHSSTLHENAERWQGQGLAVVSSEVSAEETSLFSFFLLVFIFLLHFSFSIFLLVFEISRFIYNQINRLFLAFFSPKKSILKILFKTHR